MAMRQLLQEQVRRMRHSRTATSPGFHPGFFEEMASQHHMKVSHISMFSFEYENYNHMSQARLVGKHGAGPCVNDADEFVLGREGDSAVADGHSTAVRGVLFCDDGLHLADHS
jgi:hypothetical protein